MFNIHEEQNFGPVIFQPILGYSKWQRRNKNQAADKM